MPYNTTAIPPKKEPTGQTQLPLSRVKKIISQDTDIHMCSNNAAFIITCAAEMFIQHLADEAHTQAKLERKPRRNVQYKDVANAASHHDHLEFLEDVVPKTVQFKKIKAVANATQTRLRGETMTDDNNNNNRPPTAQGQTNGSSATIVNGEAPAASAFSLPTARPPPPPASTAAAEEDPSSQLELEMRQARGDRDADVDMTG
jgi:DNA polymerase epsilon subunit 4